MGYTRLNKTRRLEESIEDRLEYRYGVGFETVELNGQHSQQNGNRATGEEKEANRQKDGQGKRLGNSEWEQLEDACVSHDVLITTRGNQIDVLVCSRPHSGHRLGLVANANNRIQPACGRLWARSVSEHAPNILSRIRRESVRSTRRTWIEFVILRRPCCLADYKFSKLTVRGPNRVIVDSPLCGSPVIRLESFFVHYSVFLDIFLDIALCVTEQDSNVNIRRHEYKHNYGQTPVGTKLDRRRMLTGTRSDRSDRHFLLLLLLPYWFYS
ncbi:hypothetical protein EVAR_16722_1 [Eumeta japonica]|uniref:Uncharacterized protein n=1 Tax=Eumeta variegata TaxID=151549 RepID=A0A4C1V6N0_EUMVA|nr:hypothetical protein EVAR_16722_1 [Eumeta japonica]